MTTTTTTTGPDFQVAGWVLEMLAALGNPAPSNDLLNFVAGWGKLESGSSYHTKVVGAAAARTPTQSELWCNTAFDYNLLNVANSIAGCVVGIGNSAGVVRYGSESCATTDTADRLLGGLYPALSAALKGNHAQALGMPRGKAVSAGVAADLMRWDSENPQYPVEVLRAAQATGGIGGPTLGGSPRLTGSSAAISIDWMRIAQVALGALLLLVGLSMMARALLGSPGQATTTTLTKGRL